MPSLRQFQLSSRQKLGLRPQVRWADLASFNWSSTFPIQYRHRTQPLEFPLTAFPLTSLITLLIGLLMLVTGINVGRARGRYGARH